MIFPEISEISYIALIHDKHPSTFLMQIIKLHWDAHPPLLVGDNLIIMNKSHYHKLMEVVREHDRNL